MYEWMIIQKETADSVIIMAEESDQKLIRYIYDVQRRQIQKQRDRREFEASVREIRRERNK